MTAALGNVNVAPGGVIGSPVTTHVEVLASHKNWSQDGVTLRTGSGVLEAGTVIAEHDDGTFGPVGTNDRTVANSVTFTDSGDLVTTPVAHALAANDPVKVASVTGTTGITAGTVYYVKTTPSSTTLTLSTTKGGSTLALTTDGTGGALTKVETASDSVGVLRRRVDTGQPGDIPKFGNRIYKGVLKYDKVKAANGNADLDANTLAALNARVDRVKNYLIIN